MGKVQFLLIIFSINFILMHNYMVFYKRCYNGSSYYITGRINMDFVE